MKHWKNLLRNMMIPAIATVGMMVAGEIKGQTFSVEAYQQFLDQNKGMTAEGMESMYDAGSFRSESKATFSNAYYADSIDKVFRLTDYEKSLIARHGFMVSERLRYPSFGDAFHNVFIKDLPVFVSTDAILHALHKSYDRILMDIESYTIVPTLDTLLEGMAAGLPPLAQKYSGNGKVLQSLNDADIYLTVARRLLRDRVIAPTFSQNAQDVNALTALVNKEEPADYSLFGEVPRSLDFSQFTVRGHYTERAELGRYFRAMMWLGRTEIYLTMPKGVTPLPTEADIQRQVILATLLNELMKGNGLMNLHGDIDQIIGFMVGASDNVTPVNMSELISEQKLKNAADLADTITLKNFQDALSSKPYAGQKILSQIMMGDPLSPDKITPPSAYMLFGQRFIIDSYVFSNVVHDKVDRRMLPSALDALFALGNDGAGQLLQPELKRYNYAPQLASLRYLIDSYDSDYWQSTMYNGWLGAIRSLNPPADRSNLPGFMQTAAWWQEKMNTQLASWAELRHDNLLYAKQSYSGGIGCSYPKGYVEPIPAFYQAVAEYARRGEEIFTELGTGQGVVYYFQTLAATCDTLKGIAEKELVDEPLNDDEIRFIQTMLTRDTIGCGEIIWSGWYPALFYGESRNVSLPDFIVADVHTSPTDEEGNMVGWVMHVGTGYVDMAVVTCTDADGEVTAYMGPVSSYHEHVTSNFKRLTDEEWAGTYHAESTRPEWTNLYLAGPDGEQKGEVGITLRTDVSGVETRSNRTATEASLSSRVFPNPTSGMATIAFTLPSRLTGQPVTVGIYDSRGKEITRLLSDNLSTGNYLVRWDGRRSDGSSVAAGEYFYRIAVGETNESGAIQLLSSGK